MRAGSSIALLIGLLLAIAAPTAHADTISWDVSAIPGATYFRPSGIAIGSDGNVYVGDTDRVGTAGPLTQRIVSFDPNGTYVSQFQTGYPPDGIAADSNGNLYVATDRFTAKVDKYSLAGTPGIQFSVNAPAGVAIGPSPNDELFAASHSQDQVLHFNSSTGASLGNWTTTTEPWAVAAAPGGDIYVTKHDDSVVSRYHPDGTLDYNISIAFPDRVAADTAGNVYVTNGDGVTKYDSTGTFLGIWSISRAQWIAVDGSGRVYVTRPSDRIAQPSGGQVTRLDPSTEAPIPELIASPPDPLASQLVTFDASGSTPPAFGTITHYQWDLDGDGTYETDGGASPTIARRFSQVGTETVGVRVTASVGAPATKTITLSIGAPYTFMSAMPGLVVTGQPVTFDAGPSAMEGSDIERFQWDFNGDGTYETDTGTTSSVQHAYATPGAYTASVRVTRSGGRVDTATAPVEVRLAPPPGEVGVSINGGAFATNDPHVTLSPVWPVNAESLLVSNDGGFGDAGSTQLFPVAPEVEWTLPSAGAERLPKTVYVRFRISGTSAAGTYTDDIILDENPPLVTFATAAHRLLRVRARDGSTGVATLVVKKAHARTPTKTKQLAPGGAQASTTVNTTVKLPPGLRQAYVRAVDAVGNKSRWRWIKFH